MIPEKCRRRASDSHDFLNYELKENLWLVKRRSLIFYQSFENTKEDAFFNLFHFTENVNWKSVF